MTILLGLLIVGLMAMVLFSLLRGLNAFRQSMDADADHDFSTGPSDLQLAQNKMMWSRIKYQALAIGVVGIALAFAR